MTIYAEHKILKSKVKRIRGYTSSVRDKANGSCYFNSSGGPSAKTWATQTSLTDKLISKPLPPLDLEEQLIVVNIVFAQGSVTY